MRFVHLSAADDGVRILSMDRPPVNALGRELVCDLTQAILDLREDAAARCLVLRSAGKHFSAGADLKERAGMSLSEVREFVPKLGALCASVASLPFPTLAAVRGAAAGGGCELALACDMRLLAADATIGLRETALAIIPGAGGTQRLARLLGPSRAKYWIFSARMFTAEEAFEHGAAERVVPAERLDDEARELAAAIAANGPVAERLAKRAIDRGADLPLASGLEIEWECYQGTLETADRREALAAFAEKRLPRFQGT